MFFPTLKISKTDLQAIHWQENPIKDENLFNIIYAIFKMALEPFKK